MTATTERSVLTDGSSQMLTVDDLATLLKVTARTIHQMTADGRLPTPIRLSSTLVRWPAAVITRWIDQGCPASRG